MSRYRIDPIQAAFGLGVIVGGAALAIAASKGYKPTTQEPNEPAQIISCSECESQRLKLRAAIEERYTASYRAQEAKNKAQAAYIRLAAWLCAICIGAPLILALIAIICNP
jgi:hypothetical protein